MYSRTATLSAGAKSSSGGTNHRKKDDYDPYNPSSSPFSLSSLAVNISQPATSLSGRRPSTDSQEQLSVTPEWLCSTIPMTSPSSDNHFDQIANNNLHKHQHGEEEEPEWLLNDNSPHHDNTMFSMGDEDHHHKSGDTPKKPNNHHHHHLEQYELYSEEQDEGVLLSETHLFRQIIQPTAEKRRVGLNNVIRTIINHAKLWQETGYIESNGVIEDESNNSVHVMNPSKFFHRYSSIISRFAYECPFEDVSSAFMKLIEDLDSIYGIKCIQKVDKNHNGGLLRCISYFFSPTSLKPIYKLASLSDSYKDTRITKEYFKIIFIDNGIIPHLSQVLFSHPSYAEIYYKTFNFVMKSNGPLPLDWRSYIAIIAASRHNCKYIVRRLEVEFVLCGGDPKWLQGIEFIPQKLKKLLKFNTLLCHMPWMLMENHITELVTNDGTDAAWTIAEVVHAVTIMCHFHSLPGLIYGVGLLPDDDETPVADIINSTMESEEVRKKRKNETQKLVETLSKHSDDEDTPIDKKQRDKAFEGTESAETTNRIAPEHVHSNLNNFDCFSNPHFASLTFWDAQAQEKKNQQNLPVKSGSEGLIPPSDYVPYQITSSSRVFKNMTANRQNATNLKKYKHSKYDYTYKDFDVKSKDYETTSIYDYNWEENAFSLLSRFYNGAADLLDEEFEFIYNMTDNRCYDIKDVDTSSFRAAIWCYVHRLYGVSHDDFNYEKVNKLLNIDLKKYIKTVVCYPERCTKEQFVNMGLQFRTKEKIHICLLAMEARKQVEMIYGLKCINNYMQ